MFSSVFIASSVFSDVKLSDVQRQLLDTLPPDQQKGVMSKMLQADQLNNELEEIFEEFDTTTERTEKKKLTGEELREYKEKSKNWIYGYEVFQSSPTTFAPATDIPVSGKYVIGPGDELSIEIYGNKNVSYRGFVNRNGDIAIPEIGPINLAGLTLDLSRELISKKISSKTIGSEAYVSLGRLRTISINILGEAYQPGSYKVSSLSTLSNLLFVSGGVSEIGSVRNIEIKRKGKTISTFDLYDLLLKGDASKDISLEQGDTIFIPIIQKTARVYGSFRRPHLFEIKDKETLRDLVFLAGGLENQVQLGGVLELTTFKPDSVEVNEFSLLDNTWMDKTLNDGDTLTARTDSVYFDGVVELAGEFKYPGFYRIKKNEKLLSVIKRAGGYTSGAYPLGAIFKRKSVAVQQKLSFERSANDLEQNIADVLTSGLAEGLTGDAFIPMSNIINRLREINPSGRQVIEADILKIKSNPGLDFVLQGGDVLEIPPRPSQITVIGEVLNPSSYSFTSGKKLQHYINNAGGFKDSADKSSVFMILPNGETKSYARSKFTREESFAIPGTTIVVPRESRPQWVGAAAAIAPLLTTSAASLASIIALLDD